MPNFFIRRYRKHEKDPAQIVMEFDEPNTSRLFMLITFGVDRDKRNGTMEERFSKAKFLQVAPPSLKTLSYAFEPIDLTVYAARKVSTKQKAKIIAADFKQLIDRKIQEDQQEQQATNDGSA